MNKKEKENKEMIKEIFDKETEIVEVITDTIINFYQNKENNNKDEWNNLYDKIVSYMHISLVQTYKITMKKISEIYDFISRKDTSKIKYKDIEQYTYTGDGLTLEKRILKHIKTAKSRDFTKANKDALISKEIRILDTETMHVNQKSIKAEMKKKKVEYVCLFPGGGCDRDCCNAFIEEWMPIDEIEDPPYHTNCKCFITYSDSEPDDEEE